MRIFITGGTGFVGKPTVSRLLKKGHKILLLARDARKAKKIFGKHKNLFLLKGNLADIYKWKRKMAGFRPDVCVHLAWEGIPDYGVEASIKNLQYGIELMRAFVGAKCKRIVASGTCWEYGATQGKLSEEMGLATLVPIASAKTAVHWLGKEMAANAGIEFCWARLFFVYGPGQRTLSLIPHLIATKKIGKNPGLKRPMDGNDFVYVDDVADALVKIVGTRMKNDYALYNIGTGKLTSNARVANIVYGKKVMREPKKPYGFWADISRVKGETGWKPLVGIEEGIKSVIKHLV